MTLVFLDMAAPFARSGAVSGSTSTSQNWVAKPGATEFGFIAAAATIGPPVCARLAAISISWHTTWSDLDRAWSS